MAKPTDTHTSAPAYDPAVLRGRDDFFSSVYRFFDGLAKHKAALWVVFASIIGVGGVVGFLANRQETQSEAGKNALFTAQKAYEAELKSVAGVKPPTLTQNTTIAGDAADQAKASAAAAATASKTSEATASKTAADDAAANKRMEQLTFQHLDVEAKFPDSVAKYKGVIEQYSGTRSAFEAQMSLGDLYFNHGEPAKAIALYQGAAEHAPGKFEKSLALSALGYSNENAGKPTDALVAFKKAIAQGEAAIKGDVLIAIARNQETLHDTAGARKTYDQVIQELAGTEYAKTSETLKAQLQ